VSEVALNPGGKSARVYVALDSAVKDIVQAEKDTIAGLEAAKGYIRYELKERMGVRHVPDLAFLADRSGRFQARIEELMDSRASAINSPWRPSPWMWDWSPCPARDRRPEKRPMRSSRAANESPVVCANS